MNTVSQLAQSVDIFSMYSSTRLQKQALSKGFSQDQLDTVSKNELESFGNWSYLAFQSKTVGLTAIIVSLLIFGSVLFVSPADNTIDARTPFIITSAILAFGGAALFRYGKNEERRSALACAVLREKAAGMSHDQISVLKDHPEIRGDRHTQQMLETLQRKLNANPATS